MDLDNITEFGRLDYTGLLRNIEELPFQVEVAYNDASKFTFPSHYIQAKNILLLGTGSNYIANEFVRLISLESRVPIIVWGREGIPDFVDHHTLVIANSYSGDDALVVKSFNLSAQNGAKLLGITTGGMIASLCRKYKSPCYEIIYGSTPRAAIGFPITVVYILFQKLGLVDNKKNNIKDSIALIKGFQQKIKSDINTSKNIAKQISLRIAGKNIITIGADHLSPVALRLNQQLAQTAKKFSYNYCFEDLLEGKYLDSERTAKNREKLYVVLFKSNYYSSIINSSINDFEMQRKKEGLVFEPIEISATSSKFDEGVQAIMLSDYISYYLAIHTNTIPEKLVQD